MIPLLVLQMFSSQSPSVSSPIGVTSHTNYQLAPPPSPPQKGGRDHRDTPITRVYASVYPRIGSPIGVTSHITPLPMGEGQGGGASWARGRGQLGQGGGAGRGCERPLYQYISYTTLPSFRDKGELVARKDFSTFKNRLFLRQEGRSLQARRA